MATKKQRRRREKGKRHEYEYVWVDEEGQELDEDAVPDAPAPAQRTNGRSAARKSAKAAAPTRGGIQPPSWRRVLKRAAIFVPLMFVAISILPGGDDLTTAQKALVTAQWALILIPFMYLMEVVSYRVWKRRAEKAGGGTAKR